MNPMTPPTNQCTSLRVHPGQGQRGKKQHTVVKNMNFGINLSSNPPPTVVVSRSLRWPPGVLLPCIHALEDLFSFWIGGTMQLSSFLWLGYGKGPCLRGHMTRTWGQPLGGESHHKQIACRKMGTSVLQPQETKFDQEPKQRPPRLRQDHSPGQYHDCSFVRPGAGNPITSCPEFWPQKLQGDYQQGCFKLLTVE